MSAVHAFSPTTPVEPWGARLMVALPEGIVRHPALVSSIERAIGRFSLVDIAYAGIRVAYGLDGPSYKEAERQSGLVVERVLGTLGLTTDAVVEHFVLSLDGAATEPKSGHLRVVR